MPSAGATPAWARIASQSLSQTAHGIEPVGSRSSKYTRARDGRRFTSSTTSCTRANDRSLPRSARAYSPTGNGPASPLPGIPSPVGSPAGEAADENVDIQVRLDATIDGNVAPRPAQLWPLTSWPVAARAVTVIAADVRASSVPSLRPRLRRSGGSRP